MASHTTIGYAAAINEDLFQSVAVLRGGGGGVTMGYGHAAAVKLVPISGGSTRGL